MGVITKVVLVAVLVVLLIFVFIKFGPMLQAKIEGKECGTHNLGETWASGCKSCSCTNEGTVCSMIQGCQEVSVGVGQLLDSPQSYVGKVVCARGTYVTGVSISAIGNPKYEGGKFVGLQDPAVWVDKGEVRETPQCTNYGTPEMECTATICGKFDYNPSGGFGTNGQYKSKISGDYTFGMV